MPTHDGKALCESWQDLWNGNLAVANEIIAPNFVAHFAPSATAPAGYEVPRS